MMDDGALKHQSPDEIASEADIQGMLVLTIHNPEVVGSWPTPATLKIKELRLKRSSLIFYTGKQWENTARLKTL